VVGSSRIDNENISGVKSLQHQMITPEFRELERAAKTAVI
jgi:hypothetical protein